MEICIYFDSAEQMWNVEGQYFMKKGNAILNAEYRLERIGGEIKIFKRNGAFQRNVIVAA